VATLIQSTGYYSTDFGWSVAIDGDTIVACGDMTSEIFVYVKPAAGWRNTLLPTVTLSAPPGAGCSLAISGNTIVVGSPAYGTGAGSAYVFVEPAGGWTNMNPTATLTPSDSMDSSFGDSVAISGDTVIVGDRENNSYTGAAYVFVKPATGWANMTQTAKLTASDGQTNDSFGISVSVSNHTIAVGASQAYLGTGKAYVFVQPQGGWTDTTQTAELTGSDTVAASVFGTSVAVDSDTIAVGAPGYPGCCPPSGCCTPGEAYSFVKPSAGWANMTQTASLVAVDRQNDDQFGLKVTVVGNAIVVGAPGRSRGPNLEVGGAYVFGKPASGWKDLRSAISLTASPARRLTSLGWAVGLSKNVMIVGAPVFHPTRNIEGVAYIFERPQ
jgi:hypothetical protein